MPDTQNPSDNNAEPKLPAMPPFPAAATPPAPPVVSDSADPDSVEQTVPSFESDATRKVKRPARAAKTPDPISPPPASPAPEQAAPSAPPAVPPAPSVAPPSTPPAAPPAPPVAPSAPTTSSTPPPPAAPSTPPAPSVPSAPSAPAPPSSPSLPSTPPLPTTASSLPPIESAPTYGASTPTEPDYGTPPPASTTPAATSYGSSAPSYGSSTPAAPSYGSSAPTAPSYAPAGSGSPGYGPAAPAATAYGPASPYGSPPSGQAPWAGGYAPGQIPPRSGGNGLAITSLILGGGALLVAWVPVLNYVTIIGALVGLVLGIIAVVRKLGSRGLSLAALIVSGVAFLLTLILVIAYTVSFINLSNDDSDSQPSSSPSDSSEQQPGDPVATPGPAEASAGATVCAPGKPVALGETGILVRDDENQFQVTVESADLDATKTVLDENQFNNEPPSGYEYGIVSLTVKALGDETIYPGSINLVFEGVDEDLAIGAQNAVLPKPDMIFAPDLEAGDTVTGNVAVLVPTGKTTGTITLSSYAGDNVCELAVD